MKNFMKFKAVIFDLDNTLVDFIRMKKLSCEAAVSAMISAGLKMSRKNALVILYEIYGRYGIEEHRIFQRFLRRIKGRIDYKILSRGIGAYRKARSGLLEPYSGVRDTLSILRRKGVRLCVVSDAPKLNAWIRLSSLDLDNFFEFVIAHNKKPRVKPFRTALRRLKLNPSEVLVVGNDVQRDIFEAKKLGIKTAFAYYSEHKPCREADFVLREFGELMSVV